MNSKPAHKPAEPGDPPHNVVQPLPVPAAENPARAPFPIDRTRALQIAGGLLAVLVLWKAADWWTVGRFEQRTDNAYVRADITVISPKIQGYISKIHVADHQSVKAGDLLLTLENADGAARLAEARAALSQAEADAAQAVALAASRKASITSARAELSAQADQLNEARAMSDAASADARVAASELKRDSALAARGHYPAARLETAQAAADASDAARKRASAGVSTQASRVSLARSGIARTEQDWAAAQAALQSAAARVEAARARLTAAELETGRAEVRSPVDGIIANRTVSAGQLLNPGQQAMSIVPVQSAYLIANFKETQVERMRPGQRVEVRLDAYKSLKIEGTVESLAPASGAQFSLIPQDTATGNFTKIVQRIPVRIRLSDEALATGLMRPGLSAEAVVTVKAAKTGAPHG